MPSLLRTLFSRLCERFSFRLHLHSVFFISSSRRRSPVWASFSPVFSFFFFLNSLPFSHRFLACVSCTLLLCLLCCILFHILWQSWQQHQKESMLRCGTHTQKTPHLRTMYQTSILRMVWCSPLGKFSIHFFPLIKTTHNIEAARK